MAINPQLTLMIRGRCFDHTAGRLSLRLTEFDHKCLLMNAVCTTADKIVVNAYCPLY